MSYLPIVTRETWRINEQQLSEKTLQKQSENEIAVFFNTLFTTQKAKVKLSVAEDAQERKRQNFLKRLFISLAWLQYTTTKNGKALIDWNYPLAASLARGGRVLIVADKQDIEVGAFLDFLATGDNNNIGKHSERIYHRRALASHGIGREENRIIEENLKGIAGVGTNILGSILGHHRYIDIALGGLGSPQKDGSLVGPGGTSINSETGKIIKGRQHGHIYINLNEIYNAMLIGIETSAPGKENMFGSKHGAAGAFQQAGNKPSVIGGYKWSAINSIIHLPVPHEYGGKRLTITSAMLERIKQSCAIILSADEEAQKEIFYTILMSTGPGARQKIEEILQNNQ